MAITFNNLRNTDWLSGQQFRYYNVVAAGPTYTSRAIVSADIFTDTAVTGDYMLFGFQISPQQKFAGLSFHITTAMASTSHTITWEYQKTDTTFAALAGVTDNTTNFTVTGTGKTVTWTVPTDWGSGTAAINGFTGIFWARARISAAVAITEGGACGVTKLQYYDNAVSVEASHEYDSGTATAGTTTTLTDGGKAWVVDSLIMRIINIHTGTGSGQVFVVKKNTATVITLFDASTVALDSTSQYSILANFSDCYAADVAAGWGVVTKGINSNYSFNCYLMLFAAAFGDVQKNVEFGNDMGWFTAAAATSRYIHQFGWRCPKIYGLEAGIMGNSFLFHQTTNNDARYWGFFASSAFAYSYDNIYRNVITTSIDQNFLSAWFQFKCAATINDRVEGWRGTTFPTAASVTEVRAFDNHNGYGGIEQPQANFYSAKVYYPIVLSLFLSITATQTFRNIQMSPNNLKSFSDRFQGAFIQYFGGSSSVWNLIDLLGTRFRPLGDIYGSSTSVGEKTNSKKTIRLQVMDEYGNLLPNATVTIKDSPQSNVQKWVKFDLVDDYINVPNATANQAFGCTAFSVEAWVYSSTSGEGSIGRILDKIGASSAGYQIDDTTSSLRFRMYTGGVLRTSSALSLNTGYWHHVVGVYDGSTVRIYVDNNASSTGLATGTVNDDTGNTLYIGNRAATDATWDGWIRRVRIFRNVALSASDVSTLWNNGDYVYNQASPIAGCTGEYNFTEGTGTTVADTSGNGNTATFGGGSNAPTWVAPYSGITNTITTTTTGTLTEFLSAQTVTSAGTYSLTSQPTSATKLRVVISNFSDLLGSLAGHAILRIQGTDADSNIIEDVIIIEGIGNDTYFTKSEFLTVTASGLITKNWTGIMTIDRIGIIYPQTVTVEQWTDDADIRTVVADYNPISIKVSCPGFEPVTRKLRVYEPIDDVVSLTRSILEVR